MDFNEFNRNRSALRKAVFADGIMNVFEDIEKTNPDVMANGHEGNWCATKIATLLIGLNIYDIVDHYEYTFDDLDEDEFESQLAAKIYKVAFATAVDVFCKAMPMVGTNGNELCEAIKDVIDDISNEITATTSAKTNWDDVPHDIVEMLARNAGISIDELKQNYAFKALNSDGSELSKEELSEIDTETTLFTESINIRNKTRDKQNINRVEDQENALDEFLKWLE